MSTADYERILRETGELTHDQQKRLVAEITERLRAREPSGKKPLRWEDLAGTAPYPLCGEDATKYISRMRDEWEEREKLP